MFSGLLHEIRRLMEALLGKWSLVAFKTSVEEAAEEMIRQTEAESGMKYRQGKTVVKYFPDIEISADILLIFSTPDGKLEEISAHRTFPKRRFISEAISQLSEESEIIFPIEK